MAFAAPGDDGSIVYEPYHTHGGVSVAANLRQALADGALPGGAHDSVLVTTDAPVLLVPVEEYAAEAAQQLYAYTYGGDSADTVAAAPMAGEGVVALFAVNRDLRQVLADRFADVCFAPLMLTVWEHFHRQSFSAQHRRLFAYVCGKTLHLSLFRHNRFDFCNSFTAPDTPDALYYVLNVWRQTGLKTDTDELVVVGEGGDALVAAAREYLRHVTAAVPATEFGAAHAALTEGLPFDLQTLFLKKIVSQ